jgi:hypothetical protein
MAVAFGPAREKAISIEIDAINGWPHHGDVDTVFLEIIRLTGVACGPGVDGVIEIGL